MITQEPPPRVVTGGPPHLPRVTTPIRDETRGRTCNQKAPTDPQTARLCVPLCCCYCDIKQTGDLHYSSGQRGHRERGCHGNGPLHGCQNCLIIQDHHH